MAKGKLTNKQKKFIQEYLIDLNGTQAAIRAGYSKKRADQIGFENLRKPDIRSALEKAQQKQQERTQITADYVLTSIRSVAQRCMQAEPVMIKGEDGQMIESGKFKFDSSGANKALENLGKYLKLFTERMELKADISLHESALDDLE